MSYGINKRGYLEVFSCDENQVPFLQRNKIRLFYKIMLFVSFLNYNNQFLQFITISHIHINKRNIKFIKSLLKHKGN